MFNSKFKISSVTAQTSPGDGVFDTLGSLVKWQDQSHYCSWANYSSNALDVLPTTNRRVITGSDGSQFTPSFLDTPSQQKLRMWLAVSQQDVGLEISEIETVKRFGIDVQVR